MNLDEKLLICPITQDVMNDPVLASDGMTYERAAIRHYFSTFKAFERIRSPVTNVVVPNTALITNYALKNVIEVWRSMQQVNKSSSTKKSRVRPDGRIQRIQIQTRSLSRQQKSAITNPYSYPLAVAYTERNDYQAAASETPRQGRTLQPSILSTQVKVFIAFWLIAALFSYSTSLLTNLRFVLLLCFQLLYDLDQSLMRSFLLLAPIMMFLELFIFHQLTFSTDILLANFVSFLMISNYELLPFLTTVRQRQPRDENVRRNEVLSSNVKLGQYFGYITWLIYCIGISGTHSSILQEIKHLAVVCLILGCILVVIDIDENNQVELNNLDTHFLRLVVLWYLLLFHWNALITTKCILLMEATHDLLELRPERRFNSNRLRQYGTVVQVIVSLMLWTIFYRWEIRSLLVVLFTAFGNLPIKLPITFAMMLLIFLTCAWNNYTSETLYLANMFVDVMVINLIQLCEKAL